MKTRAEARIWVYRMVARSLRGKAEKLNLSDCMPASVKRARAEMLKLADQLEAKALKLDAALAAKQAEKDMDADYRETS